MKRTISGIVILFLFGWVTSEAQYLSYGAKLGLSFPGFQDERIASERITPTLSFVGNVNITRDFLVQLELGYERKGNKYTNQEWDQTTGELIESSVYDVKTNLDYITIPLFLKYNLGSANKFYGQLGGYYGYLLNANFTGMLNDQMVKKEGIRDGLSPHDYGLVIGGGLETPVRRGLSLLLDVKYNYGLKNLTADPTSLGQSLALKNKSFIMSMGVIIDVE